MGLNERVTASGIVIASENGKDRGIRPRWARVRLVGEGIDWVEPGQYVLVAHGRWSRQFECEHDGEQLKLVHLDNNECLIVTDEEPTDDFVGSGIDTTPNLARPEDFGAN
jgi:hypothetical protein